MLCIMLKMSLYKYYKTMHRKINVGMSESPKIILRLTAIQSKSLKVLKPAIQLLFFYVGLPQESIFLTTIYGTFLSGVDQLLGVNQLQRVTPKRYFPFLLLHVLHDFKRLSFIFCLLCSVNDGKCCFSNRKYILTSERRVEHPFAG